MKGRLNLIFDWKAMGVNAYIPFISSPTTKTCRKTMPMLEQSGAFFIWQ